MTRLRDLLRPNGWCRWLRWRMVSLGLRSHGISRRLQRMLTGAPVATGELVYWCLLIACLVGPLGGWLGAWVVSWLLFVKLSSLIDV